MLIMAFSRVETFLLINRRVAKRNACLIAHANTESEAQTFGQPNRDLGLEMAPKSRMIGAKAPPCCKESPRRYL
ncbi:MAG: hypothetical protein COA47_16310 [Robiginitomaculum sp.]|nr:MAG: hypothetical protein COA47_16310 [Robiginitomaculum sp.]